MSNTFTEQELIEKFNNLTSSQRAIILFEALDYMQQYNGRSKTTCICLAMGFKHTKSHEEYIKS